MNSSRLNPRSGQALVEIIVALVGLLVVFTAVLTLARLGFARTNVMLHAREQAGQYAMAATPVSESPGPQFIQDWQEGPDDRRHSSDDQAQAADPTLAARILVDPAKPVDLETRLPDNEISALAGASLLQGFNLVHARATTNNIQLMPAVRHLYYNTDSISIDGDVFMVWTSGIN